MSGSYTECDAYINWPYCRNIETIVNLFDLLKLAIARPNTKYQKHEMVYSSITNMQKLIRPRSLSFVPDLVGKKYLGSAKAIFS